MLTAAAIMLYAARPTLGCFVVAVVLIVLGSLLFKVAFQMKLYRPRTRIYHTNRRNPMFQKGQLVRSNASGKIFEVLSWPTCRVPGFNRPFRINHSNLTLIGNNYRPKARK